MQQGDGLWPLDFVVRSPVSLRGETEDDCEGQGRVYAAGEGVLGDREARGEMCAPPSPATFALVTHS